jgi:hypothetical protein
LWRSVLREFDLEEHELALLRRACHVADRCEALQAVVDEEGLFETNRLGERKMHPAVVELRQQEILFAKLIVAMRVPLGESGGEEDRPQLRAIRGLNVQGAGVRP